MAQLFISYRASDGKDKATALARDLGVVFGDDQVFLDKDDLRAGVRWRDEIAQTLKGRPILLLLLTPQLLAASDDRGGRRIDDPADPIRREVADALASGAHLIPLLCDGVATPPPAADLPAPFNRIGEFTWRPLRAYDWQHDVRRLVDDLHALGIGPAQPAAPPALAAGQPTGSQARRRWLRVAVVTAVASAFGVGWYALRLAGRPSSTDVSGAWLATLSPGETLSLSLRQAGDQVELNSRPVPISQRADWADYRSFWRQRFGSELDAVSYRGKGRASALPGDPLVVDIALQIISNPGDIMVDTGNLNATIAADGATMAGTLWLNGKQVERAVGLARVPAAN
ncbi:MAG: toll/interleukin-1 receptor domain-containing protein [Candidatus Accumulibacter sp.]|nr:toll/interleukin-1 receptor domain-containing protein [Accumulibacter sp.]MCB1967254.1 toll/interleukin-1 receptor domain-containing protein [Accumulibacter sp.]